MEIIQLLWKPEYKILPCNRVFRVAAIDRIARKNGGVAKIFHSAAAVWAGSINAADPGNSHPRANWQLVSSAVDDISYDLVARNERLLSGR